jgi:hypothetical protein
MGNKKQRQNKSQTLFQLFFALLLLSTQTLIDNVRLVVRSICILWNDECRSCGCVAHEQERAFRSCAGGERSAFGLVRLNCDCCLACCDWIRRVGTLLSFVTTESAISNQLAEFEIRNRLQVVSFEYCIVMCMQIWRDRVNRSKKDSTNFLKQRVT